MIFKVPASPQRSESTPLASPGAHGLPCSSLQSCSSLVVALEDARKALRGALVALDSSAVNEDALVVAPLSTMRASDGSRTNTLKLFGHTYLGWEREDKVQELVKAEVSYCCS